MAEALQFVGGKMYDTIEEINSIVQDQVLSADEDTGRTEIVNLKELAAGSGDLAFRYNKDGLYIGADKIDDAKFGFRNDDKTLFIRDGVFTMYSGASKTVEIKDNEISIFNSGKVKIHDGVGNVSVLMEGG